MDHPHELLPIGTFSRLSAISIRMLRHYQQCSVLQPALIDPHSGHRWYSAEQLVTAHWIVRLRDAGLGITEIATALDLADDPVQLRLLMDAQRERLARDRASLDERERAFHRIDIYLEGSTMNINVRTEHMPTITLAALRRVLPSYGDEGVLWREIEPLLERSRATVPSDALGGATFYDPDHRESDVDVEVWLQVAAPFTPIAPLVCREVPEQDVVMATLLGSYEGMPDVAAALGAYLSAHHLRTGPMFNIYRVSPAQDPDPTAWVTEVCFPILGRG